jgi:hypothetical protein
MDVHIVEKLQTTLAKLGAHEQAEVLDFAEFLVQKQAKPPTAACLSEEEHARIVAVLDAVAALSQESGPSVNNREHDAYLYRER